MMGRKSILICAGLFIAVGAAGQVGATRYFDTWHFNDSLTIYFNGTATPTLDPHTTPPHSGYSNLSISDPFTGSLIFYVNGGEVLDGTGSVVPHGSLGSLGAFACLPHPGDPDRFYLFLGGDSIYYSVFDRTLNGGLGDIDPGEHRIALWDRLDGTTAFTNSAGTRHTLVCHALFTNDFYLFHVTANNGLEPTPEVITTGPILAGSLPPGGIKVAPGANKLALIDPLHEEQICMFSLDRNTAQIEHLFTYHWRDSLSSFEFAPASDLFYIGDNDGVDGSLYQLNMGSTDTAQISASAECLDVGPLGNLGWRPILQLAPNGVVYYFYDIPVEDVATNHLQGILQPDVPGAGCQLDLEALDMQQPWAWWRWWPWVYWPVHNAVGIAEESSGPRISVHPMPMRDAGWLSLETGDPDRIEWLDMTGRIVRVQQGMPHRDGWRLDASGLASGTYLVRPVEGDQVIGTVPVMVER